VTPTLSVMMPNYNHARYIPEALDAMLGQSYRPFEIVIIDDGSTDDSVKVLDGYRERFPDRIQLIRNETNLGLPRNLQRLLDMAKGDYIYIPAFDDLVLPGFLERSMSLLGRHPAAGLCSTVSGIMNESGVFQGLATMPVVRRREGFLAPTEAREELHR